ncbi:MAG: FxsA family protein [Actinomycetota bacterium]|nr:FxsA family protein [Actinomycetota bacterium]
MGAVLAVILIVVPFVELVIIIAVADGIGLLPTIGLLILVSVAGAWLLGQQGMATWRRLRATLQRGEVPTEEATDGALILMGGALLLTPGFLTDVVGLALLIPVTRGVSKRAFRRLFGVLARRRLTPVGKGAAATKRAYDVRATRVRREPAGGTASTTSEPRPRDAPEKTLPSAKPPDAGGGSRDRG